MEDMEYPIIISKNAVILLDMVGFALSIFSLAIAIIAIIISLRFEQSASKINRLTIEQLTEIRTHTNTLSKGILSELREYGNFSRRLFNYNQMSENSIIPNEQNIELADNIIKKKKK